MKFAWICLFFLASCGVVAGSYNFTKGTECLNNRDYEGAKMYLTQAVESDPSCNNLNNLACAYIGLEDYDNAWECSRIAVNQDFSNMTAIKTNMSLFISHIVPKYKLNEKGQSIETVRKNLGKPDEAIKNNVTKEAYLMYGVFILKFEDGAYVGYEPRIVQNMSQDWEVMSLE